MRQADLAAGEPLTAALDTRTGRFPIVSGARACGIGGRSAHRGQDAPGGGPENADKRFSIAWPLGFRFRAAFERCVPATLIP
ncbi:MAG: hypothetical protein ACTHKH_02590 [Trinickia sp.]